MIGRQALTKSGSIDIKTDFLIFLKRFMLRKYIKPTVSIMTAAEPVAAAILSEPSVAGVTQM